MVQDPRIARGIRANLVVDDVKLKEYPDPECTVEDLIKAGMSRNSAECATSVYVEALNIPYRVSLEVDGTWKSREAAKLRFILDVDGQKVADVFCERPEWNKNSKFGPPNSWSYSIDGSESYEGRKKFCKPFCFKYLKITDKLIPTNSPTYVARREKAQAVGAITLSVYRHMASKSKAARRGPGHKSTISEVAENLLKGKITSHRTVYGAEKQGSRNGVKIFHDKYSDGEDQPLVVYQFKYCSKDGLQKLGIIPDSNPNTPKPDSYVEHNEISPEEQERLRSLKAEIRQIESRGKRKRVEVKREVQDRKKQKRAREMPGVVHGPEKGILITLADDEDDDDREESIDLDDQQSKPDIIDNLDEY